MPSLVLSYTFYFTFSYLKENIHPKNKKYISIYKHVGTVQPEYIPTSQYITKM